MDDPTNVLYSRTPLDPPEPPDEPPLAELMFKIEPDKE
jgi:hypothetical protein